MIGSLKKLVNDLDETLFWSYEEIFNIVCKEFDLDADKIASILDCRCPFGLIGYLEAEAMKD